MQDWQPFGRHLILLVEDLVTVRCRGKIELSDVHTLNAHCERLYAHLGSAFILLDARDCVGVSGEVITWGRNQGNDAHLIVGGTAIYGASRAVGSVVMIAMDGLRPARWRKLLTTVVKDEALARSWVSNYRHQIGILGKTPNPDR